MLWLLEFYLRGTHKGKLVTRDFGRLTDALTYVRNRISEDTNMRKCYLYRRTGFDWHLKKIVTITGVTDVSELGAVP